jgi:hypothetical protein
MNNISRRGLLVGGSAVGLGAALVPGRWVLAEGTGNDADSAPTNQGAVLNLAVTPGLSYVGMSGYALQSRDGANAVTDTTLGAGPRPGGAVCNMDIAVPHGALLKEFYLSGSGATNVLFRRQRFGVYAHETIASATTPGPAGTLQEIKVAIDPPVLHDATTECLLFRTDLSNVQAVSSMAIGFTPATVALTPLPSPKRVYDSRAAEPPANVVKGMLAGGVDRDVDIKNGSGVPATARAVVGNVTLTNTFGSGWVDIRPAGTAWANTSTVNFSGSGQTVANGFTATLGPNAMVTVRCGPAGPSLTDFVIDVIGYYV